MINSRPGSGAACVKACTFCRHCLRRQTWAQATSPFTTLCSGARRKRATLILQRKPLAFRWFVLADFETGPMVEWVRHLGLFASFLFLVAGASRLARFNIQVNPQPSN